MLEKNFVFMHIPKAGGSSARGFLKSVFGEATVYPEIDLHHFPPYSKVSSSQPMLYMSHLGFQFAENADAIKATLLRNPVERILSLYSYSVNPGKGMPVIGGVEPDMSLAEFLRSERPEIMMNVRDAQTWQIGYGYSAEQRKSFEYSSDRDILEQAVDNIGQIDYLGVIERLELFQQKVIDDFSSKISIERSVANRSVKRLHYSDLSSEEKQLLEQYLEKDMTLYDAVVRRL